MIGVFTLTKAAFPGKALLRQQAIAGFFMISLGNGLIAWAEMHIPSGIAAIICSLIPILVILINVIIDREDRPSFPIIAGVILGLGGIVIIFSEDLGAFSRREYIMGIVLTLAAAIAWAGGSVWLKKKNTESNLFINAGLQMFFGGLLTLPLSFAFDDLSNVTWSAEVVWPLVYLTLIGSVAAYASYAYALHKLPMTIVSLYAYINPLVAVVLGWLLLNETLNTTIWFAMILTIAGIYVVNRGYQLLEAWKAQFSAGR